MHRRVPCVRLAKPHSSGYAPFLRRDVNLRETRCFCSPSIITTTKSVTTKSASLPSVDPNIVFFFALTHRHFPNTVRPYALGLLKHEMPCVCGSAISPLVVDSAKSFPTQSDKTPSFVSSTGGKLTSPVAVPLNAKPHIISMPVFVVWAFVFCSRLSILLSKPTFEKTATKETKSNNNNNREIFKWRHRCPLWQLQLDPFELGRLLAKPNVQSRESDI